MPSGDSLANRKPIAKTPLRKAISLLSPLLIISVGLHGLAMLLPLPEKEEIVEEELDLPEPIQVSELPELSVPEPESAPAPVFVPTPEPALPPAATSSAPVAQSPIVAVQQPQIVEPLKSSPVEPQNVTPQTFGKDPVAKKDPIGSDPGNPSGSSLTNSIYNGEGRGEISFNYFKTLTDNLEAGVYGTAKSFSPEKLDDEELTFTLPTEGKCFPEGTRVDADKVMLITSLGVVIQAVEEGDGEGFVKDIPLVTSTGYKDADILIRDAVIDDEGIRKLIEELVKREVAKDGKFPFEPPSDILSYYIFKVNVVFNGQQNCPETK